jgi:hypothetical protein
MMTSSLFDRPNVRQARLIDHALQVQAAAGTRSAAAMLAICGIDVRLAVRVLAKPYLRRGRHKCARAESSMRS